MKGQSPEKGEQGMTEDMKKKLLQAVRERYWCFKGIALHHKNRYEGYGDGYMDGFVEAALMIANGIDRLDLLSSSEGTSLSDNQLEEPEQLTRRKFRIF